MKSVIFSLMGLMMLLAACNTIEDRDSAGSIVTKEQLKIAVIQTTAGSNSVILQNKTAGVIMFWDWGTGTSHKDIDTIYVPFKGTVKLKYTAFCGGGTITDSTTFTVAAMDNAYFDKDPTWKGLTGGGSGKTWVWALDVPGKMIAGNGPENCTAPAWWTITAADGNVSGTLQNEITMDLNGAANFSLKANDGSVKKGFFKMIAPFEKGGVKYPGIQVLNGTKFPWPAPADGKYHITKLTADEMSVHEYGVYNVAMYKRKGFTY